MVRREGIKWFFLSVYYVKVPPDEQNNWGNDGSEENDPTEDAESNDASCT